MGRNWYTLLLTGSLVAAASFVFPAAAGNGTVSAQAVRTALMKLVPGGFALADDVRGKGVPDHSADGTEGGEAQSTNDGGATGSADAGVPSQEAVNGGDNAADGDIKTKNNTGEDNSVSGTGTDDESPANDTGATGGAAANGENASGGETAAGDAGSDEGAAGDANTSNDDTSPESGTAASDDANGDGSTQADGNAGDANAQEGSNSGTAEQQPAQKKLALDEAFDGVLLIGDSRTMGLLDYGSIGNAEVFANDGLSVFKLFKIEEKLRDGSRMTLETLLQKRSFQTIFMMLGINEIGYPEKDLTNQFQVVVSRIRELQPNAVLVLEANFHATAAKSASSNVYNNARINALNAVIQQIAADSGCLYLDPNPVYDDGQGNMDAKYSGDGIHVKAKYYTMWTQWMLEQ